MGKGVFGTGLNTSQLASSYGVVEGARTKQEDARLDLRKKRLKTEALNREEAGLADEAAEAMTDFGDIVSGGKTPDKLVPSAEAPKKKAGTTTGKTGTGKTGTGKTGTGTGKAGLRTKTAEAKAEKTSQAGVKETKNPGSGEELPDRLKLFEKPSFSKEAVQGDDESDAAFRMRQGARKIGDLTAATGVGSSYGFAKHDANLNVGHWRQTLVNSADPANRLSSSTNFPELSSPAGRMKLGFKSRDDVLKFHGDVAKYDDEITHWFAERPGTMKMFTSELSPADQIQTIKYIIGKSGKLNADSGLTAEVEAEAKTAADQVKQAKKKAGLPATSAVETEAPSKARDSALIKTPGAPRGKWKEQVEEHGRVKQLYMQKQKQLSRAIQTNTPASRKRADAIQLEMKELIKEGKVLKEAAKKYQRQQAYQLFKHNGDPREISGILSEQHGTDIRFQEIKGTNNWNVQARDEETGELVTRFENQTADEISASFRRQTDPLFAAAYTAAITDESKETKKHKRELAKLILQSGLKLNEIQMEQTVKAAQELAQGKPFNFKMGDNNVATMTVQGPNGPEMYFLAPGEPIEGSDIASSPVLVPMQQAL